VRQGKYLPAVVLFSESIKLDPANAVTYLDRGSARKALGEVDLCGRDSLKLGTIEELRLLIWINMIGL
jgi:hypothetical protein